LIKLTIKVRKIVNYNPNCLSLLE